MKKIYRIKDWQDAVKVALWIDDNNHHRHNPQVANYIKQGYGETQNWQWRQDGKEASFVWYRSNPDLRYILRSFVQNNPILALAIKKNCFLGKAGEEVIIAF